MWFLSGAERANYVGNMVLLLLAHRAERFKAASLFFRQKSGNQKRYCSGAGKMTKEDVFDLSTFDRNNLSTGAWCPLFAYTEAAAAWESGSGTEEEEQLSVKYEP